MPKGKLHKPLAFCEAKRYSTGSSVPLQSLPDPTLTELNASYIHKCTFPKSNNSVTQQRTRNKSTSDNTQHKHKMITQRSNPITGLDRPWGFQEVEDTRFQDNLAHEGGKVVSPMPRLSLLPQEIFLVLISVRGWVNPQGYSAARRIMSMKNSSDTTGNRNRDLSACITEPQTTAPPAACPSFFIKSS